MESVEENIASTTTIFDLPLRDLLIPLAKGLKIRDIFSLRCCSRFFKEIGDEMLKDLKVLVLMNPSYHCNEMTFRVIIQKCHKLRIIMLDHVKVGSLPDETLAELLSSNPLLEEVYLISLRRITCKALSPLATSCKKLTSLAIDGNLCNGGFLEMLSERNNQLLEIRFSFIWTKLETPMEIFEAFFKTQPHLQHISLWFYGLNLSIVLYSIAEVCKDLYWLSLPAFSSGIGSDFKAYEDPVRKIVESCPKLDTLEFLGAPFVKVTHEFYQFIKSKNIHLEGPELLPCSDSDDVAEIFHFYDDDDYEYDDDN